MKLISADKLLRKEQNLATEHWKMKLVSSAETILNQFIDDVKNAPEEPAILINNDLGLILNCAVRYALGRKTYVPDSVINFIKPLLPKLDDKTIACFIQDIERFKTDVEKGIGSWGNNYDEKDWLHFLKQCQLELNKRGTNG